MKVELGLIKVGHIITHSVPKASEGNIPLDLEKAEHRLSSD